MPVVKEVPGLQAKANLLASESFAAQLNILQMFFPLDGWFAARRGDPAHEVVAVNGCFYAFSWEALAELIDGEWTEEPAAAGAHYRTVTPDEMQTISELCPQAIQCKYLVRIDLDNQVSPCGGAVVGLSRQLPSQHLAMRAHELACCRSAMSATLALHAELCTAEKLVTEMQRDAFIDPLTATLNRAGWINRLAMIDAAPPNSDAAIVMLDLDFLKQVNDTRGHSAGDDLLRLTAQTILSVLRASDAVGRLGGDEFGVVVQNATPVTARLLTDRLQEALDRVGVQISIGMALKSEGGTLKKTMQLADARMYDHKRTKSTAPRVMPVPEIYGSMMDRVGT